MKELSIKHDTTYQTIRTAVKLNSTLLNLNSDDSFLQKEYAVQHPNDKYLDIDNYIISKIQKIIEKKGFVNKGSIMNFSKNFNIGNNGNYNLSYYIAKTLIKRNDMMFKTLHGKSKGAWLGDLSEFIKQYSSAMK